MKNFLDLADLSRSEIRSLLALATRLEQSPQPEALAGRVLGLMFMNPSLRTLASFQAGMARLGGNSFVISTGSSWQLEYRDGVPMTGEAAEHIREAVPVLATYADVLGVRAFASGRDLAEDLAEPVFGALADLCPVPLINMESATNHPCQALGDWKTLDDLDVPAAGGKFVLSWANHPKALPLAVPSAAVHMAALRGMDVTVLRPEGFALPEPIMDRARKAAVKSGGSVVETDDRQAAMEGAQVLYAKSWGCTSDYGDAEADAALRKRYSDWTVQEDWFAPAAKACYFMHCLPVRREVVVAGNVLEGPRSRVIPQARNRMYAQMAVLHRLLSRSKKT
ncbi:MAG: N-acetylornithine carbamoyltransferase [Gammaproteobacteria bacterium]